MPWRYIVVGFKKNHHREVVGQKNDGDHHGVYVGVFELLSPKPAPIA